MLDSMKRHTDAIIKRMTGQSAGEREAQTQRLLNATIVLWLCGTPVRGIVARVCAVLGVPWVAPVLSCLIIFLPLALYVLKARRLPDCLLFMVVYVVSAAFFLVTLLLNPDYLYWYQRDTYGISYTIFNPIYGAIWALLMVEMAKTPRNLCRCFKWAALIMFLYDLFLALRALQTGGSWEYINMNGVVAQRGYSIEFGYSMMFVALVFITLWCLDRKKRYLVVAGVSVVLTVMFGSRGPLLCLVVFLAFLFAMWIRARRRNGAYIALVCICAALALLFFDPIAHFFTSVASGVFGVDSRTLNLILEGGIAGDSGRSEIFAAVSQALWNNPFGYGAYGDRPVVGPLYNWGYSHNIVLEFMMDFGVVPGLLLFVILVVAALRAIMCSSDRMLSLMALIPFSMCASLMMSDTFWGSVYFWMLVGIVVVYHGKTGAKRVPRHAEPRRLKR